MIELNIKKVSGWISIFFAIIVFFETMIVWLMRVDESIPSPKGVPATLLIWYVVIFLSSVTYGICSYKDMVNVNLLGTFVMTVGAILGIAYASLALDMIENPLTISLERVRSETRLEHITNFCMIVAIGINVFLLAKDDQ